MILNLFATLSTLSPPSSPPRFPHTGTPRSRNVTTTASTASYGAYCPRRRRSDRAPPRSLSNRSLHSGWKSWWPRRMRIPKHSRCGLVVAPGRGAEEATSRGRWAAACLRRSGDRQSVGQGSGRRGGGKQGGARRRRGGERAVVVDMVRVRAARRRARHGEAPWLVQSVRVGEATMGTGEKQQQGQGGRSHRRTGRNWIRRGLLPRGTSTARWVARGTCSAFATLWSTTEVAPARVARVVGVKIVAQALVLVVEGGGGRGLRV